VDSPWGSDQESDIKEIPWLYRGRGSLSGPRSPSSLGLGKKSSPKTGNGDGEIFPRRGRVLGAIPHCHT
jgi:hypothetical protein